VDLQGYSQIGQTRLYYNGVQTTASGTTANLTAMNPGTTESLTIEIDTSQGTGSATTSTYFLPEFDFSDGFVTNSFAINSNGVPSGTLQGGATNLAFDPVSYAISCESISRGNVVSFTVPSGYHTSGDTISDTLTATQPGYGQAAVAGSMTASSSLSNLSASGFSGNHSITITNPASVGEWNVVYSGTGITPSSFSIAANTGSARSGSITLYAGSTQSTVLDTLNWTQAAGQTTYSYSFNRASSENNACAQMGTSVTVYSTSSSNPISNNSSIYSDSSLNNLASSGWYSNSFEVGYWNGSSWSNTGLCGII